MFFSHYGTFIQIICIRLSMQTFTHSFTLIFHVSHISFIFIMEHVHQTFTHSFTLIIHVSHISFIVIHGTRPPDIHSLVHTNFSCLSYQFHLHTCNTSTRNSLTLIFHVSHISFIFIHGTCSRFMIY